MQSETFETVSREHASGIGARPQSMDEPRTEFLLEMYRQTSNHLNRHVLLLWQSVALLGGAYAAFALQDKWAISIHVATAIAVLLCGWFCANVYDSYAWFGRNLAIISNLERLFLTEADQHAVHPYFNKHRNHGDMVMHFQIQLYLGVGVAVVVVAVHAARHGLPSLKIPNGVFDLEIALPYLSFLVGTIYSLWVRYKTYKAAEKQSRLSPGVALLGESRTINPA